MDDDNPRNTDDPWRTPGGFNTANSSWDDDSWRGGRKQTKSKYRKSKARKSKMNKFRKSRRH